MISEMPRKKCTVTSGEIDMNLKLWFQEDPAEVVSKVYWLRGQLTPKNGEEEWPKIQEELNKQYPYVPRMLREQAE